MTSKNNRTVTN